MTTDKVNYATRLGLFTWELAYAFLFIYRCIFSVLGETVVMGLTSIADTRSYQKSKFSNVLYDLEQGAGNFDLLLQDVSTRMTEALGAGLNTIFGYQPILINIGFQAIGFVGLVALLRAAPIETRRVFYLLMLLPSFTMWSSITGKEALVVGFMGVVLAQVIRAYRHQPVNYWWGVPALLLLYIYKPHFLAPLTFLLSVTFAASYVRQKCFVVISALLLSFVLLYVFSQKIDEFARVVDWGLISMGGRSAREPFLVEEWDTFAKAPYGMFLAFMGPTLGEATNGILHIASFVESMILFIVLGYFLIHRLPDLPVYSFVLVIGLVFWTVFPNYPLGVSNPGTAVRYRTDWIMFLFVGFVFLLSRRYYIEWVRGHSSQPASQRTIPMRPKSSAGGGEAHDH